jgi:hypothetical protein
MKKENLITFRPDSETADLFLKGPTPASMSMPEWYKKMPLYMYGETSAGISHGYSDGTNTTLKACSPFVDALSFGYIWEAPLDIEIRKEIKEGQEYFIFRWRTEGVFVTGHAKEQHPTLPEAWNGKDLVMKWNFDFIITTQPGYSTFFTHPINRHDLPFRTFSGVVDTDEYPLSVKFPFQILNFSGSHIVIEKGTPLCQIIPFRRDKWVSNKIKYDEKASRISNFNFGTRIKRSYVHFVRKSKSFK